MFVIQIPTVFGLMVFLFWSLGHFFCHVFLFIRSSGFGLLGQLNFMIQISDKQKFIL